MNQQVLDALREFGPMTTRDLAAHLGVAIQTVNRALKVLRATPRRVRIHSWAREADGSRKYLRAVHATGSKPDAPRPPARKVTGAEHRATKNARFKNSSIFRLTARSIA